MLSQTCVYDSSKISEVVLILSSGVNVFVSTCFRRVRAGRELGISLFNVNQH